MYFGINLVQYSNDADINEIDCPMIENWRSHFISILQKTSFRGKVSQVVVIQL